MHRPQMALQGLRTSAAKLRRRPCVQPRVGYYVIVTIHQDHHDPDPGPGSDPLIWRPTVPCFRNPWHGGTDKAEAKLTIAAVFFNQFGFHFDALPHWRYLYNYDERGRRGRRVYDSDGWATRICARIGSGWTPCLQE